MVKTVNQIKGQKLKTPQIVPWARKILVFFTNSDRVGDACGASNLGRELNCFLPFYLAVRTNG